MDQHGLFAAALEATRTDPPVPYADCLAFSALPSAPVMEVAPSRWTRWHSRFGGFVGLIRRDRTFGRTFDAPSPAGATRSRRRSAARPSLIVDTARSHR